MWADNLTTEQVQALHWRQQIQLRLVSWAAPLLAQTKPILDRLRVGLTDKQAYSAKPLQPSEMWIPLRNPVARALATAGVIAEYEYAGGMGNSTINFELF